MNYIKAVWDLLNGKKMNTGTIVVIMAFIIQKYLGIEHDSATTMATNVMIGFGAIMQIVGYIHKIIKDKQEKKAS